MLKTFSISEQLQSKLERVEKKVTDVYAKGGNQSEDRISGHLSGVLSTELDDTFKSGADEVHIDVEAFEGTNEPESGVVSGIHNRMGVSG